MTKPCLAVLLSALVLATGLPSCKYSKEYQVVNAGNKFTITVPPWMKKQTDLKPGAAFQYANRYRNFYAIGTVADKDTVKEPFYKIMHDNIAVLKKAMQNTVVSDSVSVTIDRLPGVRAEVFGKMGGENIYFSEVLLEGNSRYYH